MYQHDVWPISFESVGCPLTTMSGTIINDPEDTTSRPIGLLSHYLFNKPIKGCDASPGLAAADDDGTVNVPRGQIVQHPAAYVLVFNIGGTASRRWQYRVLPHAGLNPGLLVSRQNELVSSEWLALPETFVKIENRSSFLNELGIARKDPASVTPRTNSVLAQPSPKSASANFGDDTLSKYFAPNVGERETGERQAQTRRQFTGEGFYLDDDAGGKSGTPARPWVALRVPAIGARRNVFAIC